MYIPLKKKTIRHYTGTVSLVHFIVVSMCFYALFVLIFKFKKECAIVCRYPGTDPAAFKGRWVGDYRRILFSDAVMSSLSIDPVRLFIFPCAGHQGDSDYTAFTWSLIGKLCIQIKRGC